MVVVVAVKSDGAQVRLRDLMSLEDAVCVHAADEHPKLVFAFGPPTIVPLDPLPRAGADAGPPTGDRRPERLVLDAARRKVAVRILLNPPVASFPEGLFWLLALPAAAAGVGTGAVWLVAMVMGAGVALFPVFIGLAFSVLFIEMILAGRALDSGSDVEELQEYMARAPTTGSRSRRPPWIPLRRSPTR